MYKKNSILDRPLRSPSARNLENAPIEFEQRENRAAAMVDKYRRHEEKGGYSCRHQWEDPQHWETTSYHTTHRLQTVVTERGLETMPRADVDILSGKMKVPAPWDRLPEDYHPPSSPHQPTAGDAHPYSPGCGVQAPRPYSPATGTPNRLLHGKSSYWPEDDPRAATQRRLVDLPKKMDGTYNPLTHKWTVPPSDTREMDREAPPSGLRSRHSCPTLNSQT